VARGRREEFARYGWAATDVPDPEDDETFLRSKLDWSQPAQGAHRDMLAWYTGLIALRRARPELTDPRLDRVRAGYGEQDRWLVVHRGRLRIAANLGPSPQRLSLGAPGTGVLAASSPAVALDGDALVMPPAAFAVVKV
jgi:maltooligosyltrehalose trehalohydrolase